MKERQSIPDKILFQPLGNHVANVRKLVWYWEKSDFVNGDEEASRKRVADAAYLHDIGKPLKFAINVNVKTNGKIEFGYSFKGHRFEASDSDQPWVEFLAKGHHDYSANDICRDTYKLKTLINELEDNHPLKAEAEKYKQILETEPLAYAHELYILEMCDQIEAEIACRFFEDDDQAETRAFMDFTITKDKEQEGLFLIDPWIFGNDQEEIKLTLAHWSMPFPPKLKEALEQGSRDSQTLTKQLQAAIKDWWDSQLKNFKSKTDQVILKRLPIDKLEQSRVHDLYTDVGHFSPNMMQETLAEQLDRKKNPHPAILLKAPTGSGKTESILFPALANNYRLFLILPAYSLLEDQKERIDKYLCKFSALSQNRNREIFLVVDTGAQMDRWIYKNGEVSKPKVNSRRHLYKGHIVLTTLDKFLYRYFSFGDKQKSFIFPHRIHRQDSLFCFDEAHSYDEISFTNFQSLVQSLYETGRSLVLMTATMPLELAEYFDYLQPLDFTDKLSKPHYRSFEWIDSLICNRENPGDYNNPDHFQKELAQIVLKEWQARAKQGKILVVVETVRDAAAIYKQLKRQLDSNENEPSRFLFLYHGRIADKLRPSLYKEIKQRDDAEKFYIVVTTSAIEVGCDLNAEILISQICPPENLIQRTGRCNRKGNILDAKVIVVGDRIANFVNTLDEGGWQKYQDKLQSLQSLKTFDVTAIGECISRSQHLDDYRVVEMFSMLHNYVYSADLTCQSAYEKGLIVTRSWTPSATLVFDDGKQGDWKHNLSEIPKISVPLDRLVIKKLDGIIINQYANVDVYERYYDQETTHWDFRPLRWGSAYAKDIVIRIGQVQEGATHSTSQPYNYESDIGFVDLPGVFIRLKTSGLDEKLLCQHNDDDQQKSAIITYIKSLREEFK
jgi:CRISPR-associated endonuclease/helicase Cas3